MRLAIIGGGPAGYTAAFEGAARGFEVSLIENHELGGTCLNHGCIPTKTLRASADALLLARHMAEFGITGCLNVAANPAALQKRKQNAIKTLGEGLAKTCAQLKVNYTNGEGSILDATHVGINAGGQQEIIESDAIIIATGSKILELPGLPFDHQHILDSNDALDMEELPQDLFILGGGVIGCELACIFRAFGCEVTIVEGQGRLLPIPGVDADVSALLAREMRKQKIRIVTGATLTDVREIDGMLEGMLAPSPFVTTGSALPKETLMRAEKIVVTVGRTPATGNLGLDKCGIVCDKRGWVVVDERLETSVKGIYAAGDVLGPVHIMLAHVAAMEGLTIVDGLSGGNGVMDYSAVPSAIFTEPEIGCVGLTEKQARDKYGNVICGMAQMRALGKAQAMSQLPGFFKIIANGGDGRIVGMQIVGAHASDMIAEGTLAIREMATVQDIASTIHAHPTLAEGIFEAARDCLRKKNPQK